MLTLSEGGGMMSGVKRWYVRSSEAASVLDLRLVPGLKVDPGDLITVTVEGVRRQYIVADTQPDEAAGVLRLTLDVIPDPDND